jgi:hypothetical protein
LQVEGDTNTPTATTTYTYNSFAEPLTFKDPAFKRWTNRESVGGLVTYPPVTKTLLLGRACDVLLILLLT